MASLGLVSLSPGRQLMVSSFQTRSSVIAKRPGCSQCRIALLGGLCQTQIWPLSFSLPIRYPCRTPNCLPFKVGFGTYRHNDDKRTHTSYITRLCQKFTRNQRSQCLLPDAMSSSALTRSHAIGLITVLHIRGWELWR